MYTTQCLKLTVKNLQRAILQFNNGYIVKSLQGHVNMEKCTTFMDVSHFNPVLSAALNKKCEVMLHQKQRLTR